MSTGSWVLVALAVAAAVAVVVWFAATKKFPERAAGHAEDPVPTDESGRGAQPGDVVERPAGPGAESQRPDGTGTLRPGP